MRPDIQGVFKLKSKDGREGYVSSDYRAQSMRNDTNELDSCVLFFEQEKLELGESCKSNLLFLFSHEEKFNLKLNVGDVIRINEGKKTVRYFYY